VRDGFVDVSSGSIRSTLSGAIDPLNSFGRTGRDPVDRTRHGSRIRERGHDLVLFDERSRRVHLPFEEMAAHASATFWPSEAIQAAVAGGVVGLLAVVAWVLEIPVLSGLVVLIGGFMVVMPPTPSSMRPER